MAMFEVGKVYKITTLLDEDDGPTVHLHCTVLEVDRPLIKITGMATGINYATKPTVVNTTSPTFVSAQEIDE